MSRGKPKSTQEGKREWLRSHPELWALSGNQIRDAMAGAGLCSKATFPADINIRAIIEQLKKIKIPTLR